MAFSSYLIEIAIKTYGVTRAQIFPSGLHHMHKKEERAEGYLSHSVSPDNDCHNKQKVKWNKPHHLYSSIYLQSQHHTFSVSDLMVDC